MEELRNASGWYASPSRLDLDNSITKAERAVWHNFAAHLNTGSGHFPSAEEQAEQTGFSKHSVCAARLSLIEKGWLAKEVLKDKGGRIRGIKWAMLTPEVRAQVPTPPPELPAPIIEKAIVKEDAADIAKVFEVFQKTINPTINYGHKTQRAAAAALIKAHGVEKVVEAARYAVANIGKEFCPTIGNPHQLRERMPGLIAYKMKSEAKEEGKAPKRV